MGKIEIRPIRIEGNIALVPLTRGYEAVIDACDAQIASQFNWCCLVTPRAVYAQRTVKRGSKKIAVLLHREILSAPHGMQVDHVNGNGLDNRRSNIRLVTHAQNGRNQRRRLDNTSGFKGVSWNEQVGKWRAKIHIDRRSIHLGLFGTAEEAHAAYCEAAKTLHGEFRRAA